MTSFATPTNLEPELRLDAITPAGPCVSDRKSPTAGVGIGGQGLSRQELDDHIEHCGHLMELADALGNTQERNGWWKALKAALEARDALYGHLRHAEFERALDQGLDYFQTAGARDRAVVERRAA